MQLFQTNIFFQFVVCLFGNSPMAIECSFGFCVVWSALPLVIFFVIVSSVVAFVSLAGWVVALVDMNGFDVVSSFWHLSSFSRNRWTPALHSFSISVMFSSGGVWYVVVSICGFTVVWVSENVVVASDRQKSIFSRSLCTPALHSVSLEVMTSSDTLSPNLLGVRSLSFDSGLWSV